MSSRVIALILFGAVLLFVPACDRKKKEVLVPAVLQRKDETPFPGRIGLLFGREEAGGDWIFLGGAIHDLPPRTPLAPLPL